MIDPHPRAAPAWGRCSSVTKLGSGVHLYLKWVQNKRVQLDLETPMAVQERDNRRFTSPFLFSGGASVEIERKREAGRVDTP